MAWLLSLPLTSRQAMAVLTVGDALRVQKQMLRGRVDNNLGDKWLLDQAGELMMASGYWRWAAQEVIEVNIVSGQSFVELPPWASFVESVRYTPALARPVYGTTISDIQSMRVAEGGSTSIFYYATRYSSERLSADGQPVPVLELYPTPSENVTGGFAVAIGGGWRSLESMEDEEYINIPPFMVPLYMEFVRRCAAGFHKENEGSPMERCEALVNTRMFRNFQARDGMIQQNLGPGRGGALRRARRASLDAYVDHSVGLDGLS